ncbi:uncharacterized protein DS421_12g365240 [Arachis hypogaea]|nr:uncharacterized protein DS421_12g365240 [Arachis hypogaea]
MSNTFSLLNSFVTGEIERELAKIKEEVDTRIHHEQEAYEGESNKKFSGLESSLDKQLKTKKTDHGTWHFRRGIAGKNKGCHAYASSMRTYNNTSCCTQESYRVT